MKQYFVLWENWNLGNGREESRIYIEKCAYDKTRPEDEGVSGNVMWEVHWFSSPREVEQFIESIGADIIKDTTREFCA